jgi:hypothetical protein
MDAAGKWAENLAVALSGWWPAHGYESGADLARELDIPNSAWNRISAGQAIVGKADPEAYAKIHVRTGLPQADPRTIPPRLKKVPTKGEPSWKERAWSEGKYIAWLANLKGREHNLSKYARARLAYMHLKLIAPPDILQILTEHIAQAHTPIALPTSGAETEQQVISNPDIAAAAKTARKLFRLLWDFLWSEEPQVRDQLLQHARNELADLYYALETLTAQPGMREDAVNDWRDSQIISGEV